MLNKGDHKIVLYKTILAYYYYLIIIIVNVHYYHGNKHHIYIMMRFAKKNYINEGTRNFI